MKEALETFKKDCEFFKKQPRDTLNVIIQAMKGEAIFEDDEKKKKQLLEIAELAREQIQYSQSKVLLI